MTSAPLRYNAGVALNNLGLGLTFFGKDVGLGATMGRVSGGLNKIETRAKRAGDALKVGLGVGAVGAAITAGVFKLASAAGTFEQELRRVQNISGASAEALGELRDAAIGAGIITQFSPEDAVQGLVNLSAAGFDANDSMSLLTTSLNLAAAGQIGVGQSTSTVATVIKGFSLETEDAALAVDQMVLATSKFKLQIEDLNLGLGKTIRGASLTNQSFTEMVVGLGIAKNTILDVSEAGNSISAALLQISKRSGLIKSKLGVNVLNSQGQFKDWLNLVVEVGDAADKSFTNAADRAAFLNKAVGRFGLSAFTTTLTQIRKVATDSNISLAEAAQQFRNTIGDAEGTAQRFADNLLDTFKGSSTLLKGTLQTLAIVVGEPFARVLKPVVNAITAGLNQLIQFINNMDDGVKDFGAALFTVVGIVLTLGGGLLVMRGAAILLVPVFKAAALAIGGILLSVVPLIPVIAALGAVVAGTVVVIKNDVGGVGSAISGMFGKVSLFFRSMVQLVRQGGFSGAVRDEVNRAENTGLKRFAIAIFRVGFRITRFFGGIRDGFSRTLATMAPTLRRVTSAFSSLGDAIGMVAGKGAEANANVPSSKFFTAGATLGKVLARIFQVAAEAVAFFVRLWAGVIRGFGGTVQRFKGVFSDFFSSIQSLLGNLGVMFGKVGSAMGSTGSTTESVGQVIGTVIAVMIVAMVKLATVVIEITDGMVKAWNATVQPIVDAITFIVEKIGVAIDKIREFNKVLKDLPGDVIGGVTQFIPGAGGLTSAVFGGSVEPGIAGVFAREEARRAEAEAPEVVAVQEDPRDVIRRRLRDESRVTAPEVASAGRSREDDESLARAIANAVKGLNITVPVSINGEEIARANSEENRDQDVGGFRQVSSREFGD